MTYAVKMFHLLKIQLPGRKQARGLRAVALVGQLTSIRVRDVGRQMRVIRCLMVASIFIIKSFAWIRELVEGEMPRGIHRKVRAVNSFAELEAVASNACLRCERTSVAARLRPGLEEALNQLVPAELLTTRVRPKIIFKILLLGNHRSHLRALYLRVVVALREVLRSSVLGSLR